ncbi:MAG: hypothetical protein CENE_03579 [Candidatus Celerinatantimonas neptuna]|nr:MAG: hypothetical protein CENE_03579 [Candidatus Celerinatantimonas neptuna]
MFSLNRLSPVDLQLEQLLQCRFIEFQPKMHQQGVNSLQAGTFLSRQRGRGMEFDEVRQYQQGDDIRHIDWRVSARTGKVHSKLFREERDRPVIIAIDLNASMYFGSKDKLKAMMACELAAIIGWHAIEMHQRTGLQLIAQEISNSTLTQQKKGWLQALNELLQQYFSQLEHLPSLTSSNHALYELQRYCPTGAEVYLISDFYHYQKQDFTLLNQINHHNIISLWQITDPFEFELPEIIKGRLPIERSDHNGWLNGNSKHFRKQYQKAAQTRQEQLVKTCQQYALPHHFISTAEDWDAYF